MQDDDPETPGLIEVNGEPLEWRPDLRVEDLLEELGANEPGVAVEKNLQVVPRSLHGATLVEPGDKLEIVRLVGGG